MTTRRSTLTRWILALLLLAALAWGVGWLRSERGMQPELGVGDLRGSGAATAQSADPPSAAVPAERNPPGAAASAPSAVDGDDEGARGD